MDLPYKEADVPSTAASVSTTSELYNTAKLLDFTDVLDPDDPEVIEKLTKKRKQASKQQTREVAALGLETYLEKEVLIARVAKELLIFVWLFVGVALVLFLQRFEDYYSLGFMSQQSMQHFMGPEPVFRRIETEPDWWEWLERGPILSLWGNATNRPGDNDFFRLNNQPLSFMLLRQFRVEPETCNRRRIYAVFPPEVDAAMPQACYPSYSGSKAENDGYGPSGQWVSNAQREENPNSIWILGDLKTYSDKDKAYNVELMLDNSVTSIQSQVAALRQGGWIDRATRVVSVELIIFNPVDTHFAFSQYTMEITETGWMVPRVRLLHFSLKHWTLRTVRSWMVFVLDILIVVNLVYGTISLVYGIYLNKVVRGYWVDVFDIIQICNTALFVAAYYFRIKLWVLALQLDGDWLSSRVEDINSLGTVYFYWDWIAQRCVDYEHCWLLFGFGVVLTFLRMFGFLHFNTRLNILSNTLRQAAPLLVSLTFIVLVVLVGWAFLGHIMYGFHVHGFRTWYMACGSLLTFLLGTREHYPDMVEVYPKLTSLYVISYMVIMWVVLLNLVLAIITGSFAAVQEAMLDPDWKPSSLWRDVQGHLAKVFGFIPHPGPRHQLSIWADIPEDDALSVLQRVRLYRNNLDPEDTMSHFVDNQTFKVMAPELNELQRELVLRRAKNQFAGTHANKESNERQLQELLESLQKNNQRVDNVEKQNVVITALLTKQILDILNDVQPKIDNALAGISTKVDNNTLGLMFHNNERKIDQVAFYQRALAECCCNKWGIAVPVCGFTPPHQLAVYPPLGSSPPPLSAGPNSPSPPPPPPFGSPTPPLGDGAFLAVPPPSTPPPPPTPLMFSPPVMGRVPPPVPGVPVTAYTSYPLLAQPQLMQHSTAHNQPTQQHHYQGGYQAGGGGQQQQALQDITNLSYNNLSMMSHVSHLTSPSPTTKPYSTLGGGGPTAPPPTLGGGPMTSINYPSTVHNPLSIPTATPPAAPPPTFDYIQYTQNPIHNTFASPPNNNSVEPPSRPNPHRNTFAEPSFRDQPQTPSPQQQHHSPYKLAFHSSSPPPQEQYSPPQSQTLRHEHARLSNMFGGGSPPGGSPATLHAYSSGGLSDLMQMISPSPPPHQYSPQEGGSIMIGGAGTYGTSPTNSLYSPSMASSLYQTVIHTHHPPPLYPLPQNQHQPRKHRKHRR